MMPIAIQKHHNTTVLGTLTNRFENKYSKLCAAPSSGTFTARNPIAVTGSYAQNNPWVSLVITPI